MEWINENVQFWLSRGTSEQAANSSKVKDLAHQFSIVLCCVYNLHVKFADAVDCEMMWANSRNVNVKIRACTVLSNWLWQCIDLLRNTSWCRTLITNIKTFWIFTTSDVVLEAMPRPQVQFLQPWRDLWPWQMHWQFLGITFKDKKENNINNSYTNK